MCIGWCQIDYYFPARDPVAQALEGGDRSQKALSYCGISQAAEVHSNSIGDVNLGGYAYRIYADAFGSIYVCQHFFLIFVPANNRAGRI